MHNLKHGQHFDERFPIHQQLMIFTVNELIFLLLTCSIRTQHQRKYPGWMLTRMPRTHTPKFNKQLSLIRDSLSRHR